MKFLTAFCLTILLACGKVENKFELQVYGRPDIVEKEVDGKIVYDTIPHTIEDFAFVNQDSTLVTNETFKDQVYIADFFFTSCPTICPVMKQQMLRVYEAYENNPEVGILSYSIDPEYDTVALLNDYAERLGVSSDKWHFVTGDKEEIYSLGESSYMVLADEDPTAPGGFIHSGAFILVDRDRQIRGIYDGTVPDNVDLLIKDIRRLLNSYGSVE